MYHRFPQLHVYEYVYIELLFVYIYIYLFISINKYIYIYNIHVPCIPICPIKWETNKTLSCIPIYSSIYSKYIRYTLVNWHNYGKSQFSMEEVTISMVSFPCYLKLQEGQRVFPSLLYIYVYMNMCMLNYIYI